MNWSSQRFRLNRLSMSSTFSLVPFMTSMLGELLMLESRDKFSAFDSSIDRSSSDSLISSTKLKSAFSSTNLASFETDSVPWKAYIPSRMGARLFKSCLFLIKLRNFRLFEVARDVLSLSDCFRIELAFSVDLCGFDSEFESFWQVFSSLRFSISFFSGKSSSSSSSLLWIADEILNAAFDSKSELKWNLIYFFLNQFPLSLFWISYYKKKCFQIIQNISFCLSQIKS